MRICGRVDVRGQSCAADRCKSGHGTLATQAARESNDLADLGTPSMQSQESDDFAAFLEGAVLNGESSRAVAERVAAIVQGIHQALVPIVGRGGMAALYNRSLHLSRPQHAWLPAPAEVAASEVDLAMLTAALADQTAVDAAAAGKQLLGNVGDLLKTLIGESLTERLLRPVWANLLSGPSARDTTT